MVDATLTADEQAMIVSAFTALGTSASIKTLPPHRGLGDLQWLVLAVLPLQSFLTAMGGKIADDAYSRFQSAVGRLVHRKAPSQAAGGEPAAPRPIILQDKKSGIQVVLDHDLPPAGYDQLLKLDLSRFRFGPVHYDRARGCWRSEVDEAEPADP